MTQFAVRQKTDAKTCDQAETRQVDAPDASTSETTERTEPNSGSICSASWAAVEDCVRHTRDTESEFFGVGAMTGTGATTAKREQSLPSKMTSIRRSEKTSNKHWP